MVRANDTTEVNVTTIEVLSRLGLTDGIWFGQGERGVPPGSVNVLGAGGLESWFIRWWR
jgi:hypothetical protein